MISPLILAGTGRGEVQCQKLFEEQWAQALFDARHEPDDFGQRGDKFGSNHFEGALTPYRDETTRETIMAILDQVPKWVHADTNGGGKPRPRPSTRSVPASSPSLLSQRKPETP